ncbi:head GIN domain-containing protein [Flaviaesturariibacter flavus]|nr:head GIN domain-containing protein [Flaviaesturariibacter flavus]
MKKLLAFAFLLLGAGSLQAQKTINDDNARVRSVPAFRGIRVSSGIDLYLSTGEPAVAVSARESEFRDRIRTEVENGVLKIWYDTRDLKNMVWGNSKNLRAYVSAREIEQLGASGGSDVFIDGTLSAPTLKVDLSGGSDFKGRVAISGKLECHANGGSDVIISGTAGDLEVHAAGGSDFKGRELVAETMRAEASGGSDIDATVNREVRASASGGSDVYYRGNASLVESNKSGGSDIKKRG